MVANKKVTPIRRRFIFTVSALVILIFSCGILTILSIIFKQLDNDITQNIIERSSLLSHRAAPFIKKDQHAELQTVLTSLNTLKIFNYVHIYKYTSDGSLEFFSSYNKKNFPAIADRITDIDTFDTPIITNDIVEWMQPITADDKLVGYSYIQLDISSYYRLKKRVYIISLVMLALCVVLASLTASHLHKLLMSSISKLVDTVKQVSKKRDYSKRCQQMDYLEFELLTKSLNTLFSRTEKHLKKQGDAEQQILKLNHDLEDKVNQRTEALKESNQELLSTLEKLHQFQGQLVENEKMASLGDMVAGLAHEVNTPIGLGVTASTLLVDRINEIKDAYEDKTLRSSQLKKFLNDGEENVAIIYRNLNRAADLISSFKQVAVDQSSEQDREFIFSELIDEVLLTLAPQLKNKVIEIQVDCPPTLTVISKPGPINQILINLIVNSIIHGFEHQKSGVINIDVMLSADQLHLCYKDDGKGVDESVKNKIFDPFVTTKRGEGGSGLGLHLVYNLVTQALGGNIQIESIIEQGVTFNINFPVNTNNKNE